MRLTITSNINPLSRIMGKTNTAFKVTIKIEKDNDQAFEFVGESNLTERKAYFDAFHRLFYPISVLRANALDLTSEEIFAIAENLSGFMGGKLPRQGNEELFIKFSEGKISIETQTKVIAVGTTIKSLLADLLANYPSYLPDSLTIIKEFLGKQSSSTFTFTFTF